MPSNQLKDYLEKYPNAQIITSPGIPPQNPMIKLSQPISEYDFFASTMPFSVWISGTNGKTTTTQMLTHLLQNKGALSGGNISSLRLEQSLQEKKVLVIVKFPYLVKAECIAEFG